MKREQLIERLKGKGSVTLDSKKLQNIMPEVYEYFVHAFRFMEEEVKDFQKGKYFINLRLLPDRVTFTVGKDAQRLANEPYWMEDRWDIFKTEELAALLKVAK